MGIELKEVEARIQTLENGIKECEERRTELTLCTDSNAKTNNECLLEECYSIRLLLHNISYQYKLAKLRYKREELDQKMKEISEEMEAERKQSMKCMTFQQERKQSTTTTQGLRKPIPKPRYTTHSMSANRQRQQPHGQFSTQGARKLSLGGTVPKCPTDQEFTQQYDQSKHWSPTPKPRIKPRPATSAAKPRQARSQLQEKEEDLRFSSLSMVQLDNLVI